MHSKRAVMHPVQAAPRQSDYSIAQCDNVEMHPVQAAPRQSKHCDKGVCIFGDAPRAGSAEAKR